MIDTVYILQAVLDNITDSVVIIDSSYHILSFNQLAVSTIRGIHSKDIAVGVDYREFVSEPNRAGFEVSFKKALRGEKTVTERELLFADGRKAWYRLQMNPVYNNTGTIAGMILTLTDIDEHKVREAALDDSEVRFRHAFEHSFLAMALVSVEGAWIRVNKTLCDIVGYVQEELMELTPDAITHADDLVKDRALLQTVLAGAADHYSIEKRLMHRNGAEEWVSGIITAIRDSDGRPLYFVWQLRHVTERIKMIQRLKASEDLLHLFVEHSPAAIAMFDTDMRYMQVSRRWMMDYNLDKQDLAGKSHYEIFPTIGEDWKKIHRQCLAGRIERNEEDSFIREDGRTEWLRWEIHPWYKEAGDIGGIIMMTEVITERQRMITDLVARNRDLSEFADMVSHTLRGPLATIMGLTNMLRENIAEPEKDKIMEGIGESAERLDEVVREMNTILNTKRIDP